MNRLPNVSKVIINGLSIRGEYGGANTFHLGKEFFYLLSIVDD